MLKVGSQMARKKANNRPRRRKFTGIKVLTAVEALMQANVWTNAAFNEDAWSFLTAGTVLNPDTKWTGQGESKVSLRELLMWPNSATSGAGVTASRFEVIQKNLTGNVFNAVVQTTLIGVGFRFAKKILRKPISQGNRLIKMAGVAEVVRL